MLRQQLPGRGGRWACGLPIGGLCHGEHPAHGALAGRWGARGDRSPVGGCRQALVDRYSQLSAEAARRERKALWTVRRHRLAGARLRFLLEDQRRVQVALPFTRELFPGPPGPQKPLRSHADLPVCPLEEDE